MGLAEKLQQKRGPAAGADDEQPDAVLRDTQICAINDVRRQLVAQGLHRCCPGRKQHPTGELGHVFDNGHGGLVALDGGNDGPGGCPAGGRWP